ncbi:MAG: ribonuclease PH [Candidatus Omnitrophica bacterium]|nr:ribonuclease PH [Candidatus Omnitrophota bacterium]
MERKDKRALTQLRQIKVQRDYLNTAEGSCLIELGDTRVLCAATVERNVPPFLKGTNTGWLTAEYRMLPRSTQSRIVRDKVSGRTMEIQRLIGRSLRSVIDMRLLGEKTIWIDCDVIQADGGTRTVSVIGGFFALVDCLQAMYKQGVITEFPVVDYLGAISVGILRGNHVLDLSYQEDVEADVDMNVVMKGAGEFVEIQGTAENGSFSKDDLDALLELAKKGILEIVEEEKKYYKDIIGKL